MKRALTSLKRTVAVLVILCLVFSLIPASVFAAGASDISGHWAQVTIQSWMNKGLIKGYPDGTFKPDQNLTRAEFMTLANRAFGFTAKATINYTDVQADAWYTNAIAIAKAAGYISGYPDNTMKPENPITREEVATIVARIKNLTSDANAASKHTDAVKISSWSKGQVGAVTSAKIMQGYPDGSFMPQGLMTRAEVVIASDNALHYTAPVATIAVRAITVTPTTMTLTAGGATGAITATVGPSNATNKIVTWSSSNAAVATVAGGVVTPVAAGTAVITATTVQGSFTATCTVTVTAPVVSGVPAPATAATISTAAIAGVTAPVNGATPTATMTATTEYTAMISWSGSPVTFAAATIYTATIILTPTAGHTLTGVTANFFTVAGATATNAAGSGVVTAVFPATANIVINIAGILGVTAPVNGATPVTAITEATQYTGTVTWAPTDSSFAGGTVYTATITLTPKTGYTLTGVAADFFTVAGTTSDTNPAGSGVVTAVFPAIVATISDLALNTLVTAPVTGVTPSTATIDATQYTGTIAWFAADGVTSVTGNFAASTVYVGKVTLTAKAGYTLTGVALNNFTYTGATSVANAANAGVVTITFPATVITDVTSVAFTLIAANNTVTITLTGGTFKTGTIAATDFTFTGTDATALGATGTTFTRTNDAVVTITGLTGLTGTNNTVLVKTATQATQASSVAAAASTEASPFTYTTSGVHEVTITGYTGAATVITIPSALGGNPVTIIGDSAFDHKETLTSVSIPNSVTSIGDYAFKSCLLLASVTIPANVTSIGHDAFYGCNNLTSVSIPDSVTSIGSAAFQFCNALASVTMGRANTTIGDDLMASGNNTFRTAYTSGGAGTYIKANDGTWNLIKIGDSFGGGIVAYILQPSDTGYKSGETHGLIAATADQSTAEWSNIHNSSVGSTGTLIGTGQANTTTIVSQSGFTGGAAKLCADLVIGIYSDWYLPSKDELAKLYDNRTAIGSFVSGGYWSSSETDANTAWAQYFNDGSQGSYAKNSVINVRAVRSF